MAECPCGSDSEFDECCGPIIGGAQAQGNLDHIENTHASEVRDNFNRSAAESTANSVKWVSLEIFGTAEGGADDETGTVEFSARFRQDGKLMMHHELSNFRREDGRWVYVDGKINPKGKPRRVDKVGRNAPCPCGSGKKFKKCCGA